MRPRRNGSGFLARVAFAALGIAASGCDERPRLEPLRGPAAGAATGDSVANAATTETALPSLPSPITAERAIESAAAPATVALALRLVDAEGRLLVEEGVGWWTPVDVPRGRVGDLRFAPVVGATAPTRHRFEFTAGRVERLLVPTGVALELDFVSASGGGRDWVPALSAPLPNPYDLVVAAPRALYRWQALEDDDQPLRERTFALCRDFDLLDRHELVRSDDAGRVEVVVEEPHDPAEALAPLPPMRLALREGATQRFALLPMGRPFVSGLHDEGNVRFTSGERVVAGRAVDERGEPLAGLPLRFAAREGVRFGAGWSAETTTDVHGEFELQDVAAPPWVRLEVGARGSGGRVSAANGEWFALIAPSAEECGALVTGAAPLLLRLRRPTRLVGRLVATDELQSVGLVVVVGPTLGVGAEGPLVAPREVDPARDGAFVGLIGPVGRLPASFRLRDGNGPELFRRELVIEETTAEIDVGEIALADHLQAVSLRVHDGAGGPIGGARVEALRSRFDLGSVPTAPGDLLGGRPSAWRAICRSDGCAELVLPRGPLQLVAAATGFHARRVEASDLAGTVAIELEPVPGVTVDVQAPAVSGLDWRRLRAHATFERFFEDPEAEEPPPEFEAQFGTRSCVVEADAAGDLHLLCGVAGSWSLRLFSIDGGSFELGRYTVEVPTVQSAVSVTVAIDEALAAAAVADAARMARPPLRGN